MYRSLILVAVLLLCCVPAPSALGQSHSSSEADFGAAIQERAPLVRPESRPAEPLQLSHYDPRTLRLSDDGTVASISTDSLSETALLHRLARLYEHQSAILKAQATGNAEEAENLLALAMTELAMLIQQPNITERARFRELYRSLVTEYEKYYGVSDTLTLQMGDIYTFRADMFLALNEMEEPLLEDVMLPAVQPMQTVVPMTVNRLVEQSIAYLLRQPDKHLHTWLSRADTYFPMVEQILAEEGVPDELKYLAMIESGLNPRARSWASAAGMWQFMAATGRAYGLNVNTWVDERLDPEKATRAAARHLRDLYKLFGGDWHLALAGYNCSPARVKRAMRQAEQRTGRKATFWDAYSYLPRETRNYVPMFIAAALVASNPDAFDVREVAAGPRYHYDYAPVQGMLSLRDVATLAGTDEATIRALNPELRRNTLPPSKEPYFVRLPLGTYSHFAEGYALLPDEVKHTTVKEHTVRRGDSLGKIARRHGVSVSELMRANGLRSTTIRPGQNLIVPVPAYKGSTPGMKLASAEAISVQYGQRTVRPIKADGAHARASQQASIPVVRASTAATPEAATQEQPEEAREEATPASEDNSSERETRVVYRVRRGDNLIEIAKKYGVSVGSLRQWNDLSGSTIRTGQRLVIYTSGAPEAEKPSEQERVVYRVRRGDNLIEIAKKYGVSVGSLRQWNDLSGSTIRTGQRLVIYPDQSATSSKPVIHRVQRGDNLTEIAKKYGVSVQDLKRWNGLKSSIIKPGQRLKINS